MTAHTSLILVLHNNGFTGIDQPNTYSRGLKMTKQKQMTEKELDQVAGGTITVNAGHLRRFVTYTEHGSPFKVEIHKPAFRNGRIGVPPEPE